jgi:16S rRNA (guanine527-N7)-methyltransferase
VTIPTQRALTSGDVRHLTGVSRETESQLQVYVALLERWQRTINLVAEPSLRDVWRRHILDSAQLRSLIPGHARSVIDLGSGAGFPGLVLALLGVPGVLLVESDARKCAFLHEAARATGAEVEIHHGRAETLKLAESADIVTARALAPLPDLLELAAPLVGSQTICLFLKGRTVDRELTASQKTGNMRIARFPSVTDPEGVILRLTEVQLGTV